MKKPLPTPVIAAIGLVAVVVLGFIFFRAAAGPPEFAEPKRTANYTEGMPDYIKNRGKGQIPGAPAPGEIPKGPPPTSGASAAK